MPASVRRVLSLRCSHPGSGMSPGTHSDPMCLASIPCLDVALALSAADEPQASSITESASFLFARRSACRCAKQDKPREQTKLGRPRTRRIHLIFPGL